MLNSYKVEDFAALRGPLESERQSPSNLAFVLLLGFLMQPLLFFLANYVLGDETKFTYAFEVKIAHMVLTIILMILCIIFAFSKVYIKYEQVQYLLVILVSQNLGGAFGYIGSIYFFERVYNAEPATLNRLAAITLMVGLFVFIITSIRFNKLLKDGKYRRGGEKINLEGNLRGNLLSLLRLLQVWVFSIRYKLL